MERKITNELVAWKNRINRKPLILNVARQVGKTYILREFGEKHYSKLSEL
jgi:predicted AAA+ superfamily ATPase